MMLIRMLQEEELEQALQLAWDVFQEYEAPVYKQEGVETFHGYIQVDVVRQKVSSGKMILFGCFSEEELVGMLALRDQNHISMFFVKTEYHRKKVGRQLFQSCLNYVSTNSEHHVITVNSSPYGVGFYHKLGFVDTGEEQERDGIRFTPMEYRLLVRVLDPIPTLVDR